MESRILLVFTSLKFLVVTMTSFQIHISTYLRTYTYVPSSGASVGDELAALFVGDLNPVAPKAQKKVPVPEG